MYNQILKTFIFPLMEVRRGTNQLKCWQTLEMTQWLSRTRIEELQYKALRAILKHAYETVPFYNRQFKKIGIKPEDIKSIQQMIKLPKLTKEEIRRNLQSMISTSVPRRKLVYSMTGGSTGEPLRFFKDKRTISWFNAAVNRNYRWAGLDLGDKYISLWGSPFDLSISTKLSGFMKNLFERHKILSSSEMSEKFMAQYVEIIRKYKPKVMKGYASALVWFAKYLKQREISDLNIHSIISTAEMLFEPDRKLLEEQFNCEVYDTYGCREFAILAGECPEHSGYHISAETALLEFTKDNESVSAGESGEILITDLQNYGMPFIRYSVGDAGKQSDEICSCGRGLPLMKLIEGRITDFIYTKDDRYIPGIGLIIIFADLKIRRFQIVQRKIDELLVRIEAGTDYSAEDERKIMSRMKKIVGENIEVIIEHVDSIPRSPTSGKHRFIVSEISPFKSI